MKRLLVKNLVLGLIALMCFFSFTGTAAMAAPDDPLDIKGEAAILVDARSGRILYEKNIDMTLHPASMTKMMTEYLVLEAIRDGKISWNQETSISEYVYKVSQDMDLSNVPLRKDGVYTVRELYESMAIYSANGSSIALAELISGSETNFVKLMNDKARELGLRDFKFVNCTGLNNSDLFGMHAQGTGADEENLMSARATATLAFHLLNDFPEVLEVSSIPFMVFRKGTDDSIDMPNWNLMLPGLLMEYKGVDGLKTGSTDLGGFSFTSTAQRDGMRILSVVMKTDGKYARFRETKKLLDYGFSQFESKELFPAGYKIEDQPEIPVVEGKKKKVEVSTQNPLLATVRKGEDAGAFQAMYQIDPSMSTKEGKLMAPVEEGQIVGNLVIKYKGEENYGYLTDDMGDRIQIIAGQDVKKAGWLSLFFRSIGDFFANFFK